MKYLFQIITAAIFLLIGRYWASEELKPHFIAEGLMMSISLISVELAYDLYLNYKRIFLLVSCKFLGLFGQYIRFSMSYQYRIRVEDNYLLVKNSNWNFYQHVGGKYKRLPETHSVLKQFGATDDLKLSTGGLMKEDLAVFIRANCGIAFLDWFNKKTDREVSHWREFYEELIDGKAKVLEQKLFPYVNYRFVTSIVTPLKWSKKFGCWEILQYDVLDIIPTPAQESALQALFAAGDTDYIKWANYELVQSHGFDKAKRQQAYEIGAHAKWVVNLKWAND